MEGSVVSNAGNQMNNYTVSNFVGMNARFEDSETVFPTCTAVGSSSVTLTKRLSISIVVVTSVTHSCHKYFAYIS